MKNIIADIGKKNLKVLLLENGVIVKSLLLPSLTEEILNVRGEELKGKSFILKLDNDIYKVGESCATNFNSDYTKMNTHSLILLDTAIHLLLDDGDEFNLYVGCPTNDYINQDFISEYKEFLKQGGIIKTNLLKEDYTFEEKIVELKNIEVLPEGMAFGPRFKLRALKIVHVIDIGGYNVNYRLYLNGNTKASFSMDKSGVNTLINLIRLNLEKNLTKNININSLDLEELIKSRCQGVDPQIKTIINYTVKKFINEYIIDGLQSRGVDIKQSGIHFIFIGGGSDLLSDYLIEYLPIQKEYLIFSKTGLYDNVISYAAKCILSEKPIKFRELLDTLVEGDFVG